MQRSGRSWALALVVMALGLGGCAAGGDVGNPLVRKATWFSYLNGDDLRAACRPGAPETLRLVFNGVYSEHVRLYEVHSGTEGRWLATRIIPGDVDLSAVPVEGLGSLLDPWRGAATTVALAPEAWGALTKALARDGLDQPPPAGLELDSADHYWVVSGCLTGRVVFNAWARGEARYAALTFPTVLVEAYPPAGPLPAYVRAERRSFEEERRRQFQFRLRVGPAGIRDLPALGNPG